MKNKFYFIYALLGFMLLGWSAEVTAQNCDYFTTASPVWGFNQFGAKHTISGGVMTMRDSEGNGEGSFIDNELYNNGSIGCGTVSYSYRILTDGIQGTSIPFTAQLTIYITTPFDSPSATFYLNNPITENSQWVNIQVPFYTIPPGQPLPANGQGHWVMNGETPGNASNWNELLMNFSGIAFNVDNGMGIEKIQVDNFCAYPASCCTTPPNAAFTIQTGCVSGGYRLSPVPTVQGTGINHVWKLMQTTTPGATTGGVQVGAVQNGNTPVFSGLSALNYYYIIHTVVQSDCNLSSTTSIAAPYHPIGSVFQLENEAGIALESFCLGEDVYLDGSASYGESAYRVLVMRRTSGTNQAFIPTNSSIWNNSQAGVVNLSQLFANNSPNLQAGYEYRIVLEVKNDAVCAGSVNSADTITIQCCASSSDASFQLLKTPISGTNQFKLTAVNYEQFNNIGANHTWTIVSSPNNDEGPYTPVAVVAGAAFEYILTAGPCYFVVHQVETDCGEQCFGARECPSGLSNFVKNESELVGVIDCNVLDNLCYTPTDMEGQCFYAQTPNGPSYPVYRLKWESINSGSNYLIEAIYNDPTCCTSSFSVHTLTYSTNNQYFDLQNAIAPDWTCVKWRVAAVCDGESLSWSDYSCFEKCDLKERSYDIESNLDVELFPNPASNQVTLRFGNDFTGTLKVNDYLGRTVLSKSVLNQPSEEFSVVELPSGVYTVILQNQQEQIVKQLVVQ